MELLKSYLGDDDIEVARLNLSGERIVVGRCSDGPILQFGREDPIYFSVTEANMVIAALSAAVEGCAETQ